MVALGEPLAFNSSWIVGIPVARPSVRSWIFRKHGFKVIPYLFTERLWCEHFGMDIHCEYLLLEVIGRLHIKRKDGVIGSAIYLFLRFMQWQTPKVFGLLLINLDENGLWFVFYRYIRSESAKENSLCIKVFRHDGMQVIPLSGTA